MEETTILTFDTYCVTRAREIEEELNTNITVPILQISLNKYRNYLKIIGFRNIHRTFIFENEKMSFFTFLSQVTDSSSKKYDVKTLNNISIHIHNFFYVYSKQLRYFDDKEDIIITREDIDNIYYN